MTKERFDFLCKSGLRFRHEATNIITGHVDMLINALYIPVKQDRVIKQVDPQRLKLFKIEQEPINWGDLKCVDVEEFKNDGFFVTIDEASPGQCPTFCDYITEYMKAYGWNCKVITEW